MNVIRAFFDGLRDGGITKLDLLKVAAWVAMLAVAVLNFIY